MAGRQRDLEMSLIKVFVTDLEFQSFHGISEPEREVGHRFRLDLAAQVEQSATETDRVEDTTDYASLALRAVEICNQKKYSTVEFACEQVGITLLDEFDHIKELTVTLAKLQPSVALNVRAVGVEKVFRRRD